jgi:ABC-type nitrate/sulfonate/bicarbonate transport system permease component
MSPSKWWETKFAWRLLAFVFAGLAWEAWARAHQSTLLFPSFWYVVRHSLPSLARFGNSQDEDIFIALYIIIYHSGVTLLRIIIGLLFGVITGVGAAMAIHFFIRGARAYRLILFCLRAIPLLALIPLFIYWFGNREAGIYVYIAFGVFIVIGTITYEAIFNIPQVYIHQARLLGAHKLRRFLTVHLYAIQPELLPAIRDVLGLCWAFSLGAEYITARSGLGYLVYQSYLYSDMGKLLILACIYIVYGYIGYLAANALTRKIGAWYLNDTGKEIV